MNSKLDLALLFRQLTTIHVHVAPKEFSNELEDIPLLMIQKVALFMLPAVRKGSKDSNEYKLSMLVTLMELNVIRNAFKEKAVDEDSKFFSERLDEPALHSCHSILKQLMVLEEINYSGKPIAIKAKPYHSEMLNLFLRVMAHQLGGMHLVVRAQVILCAWKVVKTTHPTVEEQHGSMTRPEILRLLTDVLTDMPLQEDVPAMIAEVGEGLIQRLGMAEKV